MKNVMTKAVTVLTLIVSIPLGYTDDPQAVHLDKNQAAPYDGYEITAKKAIDIRNLSIDMDTSKKVNENLTEENKILGERLQAAQQQDNFLADQLQKEKDTSFFSKAGYFIAGALVTGLIGYGVYKSK